MINHQQLSFPGVKQIWNKFYIIHLKDFTKTKKPLTFYTDTAYYFLL